MAGLFRNLVDQVGGLINIANASISPYKVQAANLGNNKDLTCIKKEDNLYLYKKTGCNECVLVHTSGIVRAFSLFRLTNDGESLVLFTAFSTKLLPLARSSSSVYIDDVLQRICDCIREHPTWSSGHVAAHSGLYESFRHAQLLCDINSTCQITKYTPLMAAVMGKQSQCVEALLSSGAQVHGADHVGNTVFHLAVTYLPKVIPILAGFDKLGTINYLNASGETALYNACRVSLSEVTELLLHAGADPTITVCDCLPIHAAVKANDLRSIELICKKYPDQVNAPDNLCGGSPLYWAETVEAVELLCRLGCDTNSISKGGDTVLHFMIEKQRLECLMELLYHGANPNMVDTNFNSPLHLAVQKDDPQLVKTFIVFGSDVNLRNKQNQTPRHFAATCKGKNSDLMLHMLHLSGSKRCFTDVKGCLTGCSTEGFHNGKPDETTEKLMKFDDVALLDEMLSAAITCSARMTHSNSRPLLDMVDAPNDIGDRVLCLDGGGIRGLVLIQLLSALEIAACQPIKNCFDWIGGTSTGAILALGIATGRPISYIKGMYFRLKEEAFCGKRPYPSEPLERLLKREFGETTVMSDLKGPKVMVTAVMVDRFPAELYFFRNYTPTLQKSQTVEGIEVSPLAVSLPEEQLVWKAARCSGAAPTYFRPCENFLDGGLMSNNPTLDVLTEIHEYNCGLKLQGFGNKVREIGCVVSLGTGRVPVTKVNSADVYRPEGLFDAARAVKGIQSLMNLFVDQDDTGIFTCGVNAMSEVPVSFCSHSWDSSGIHSKEATCSYGRPVDRARAWCGMMNVPYYRFSPQLSEDTPLDTHDNNKIMQMMWETQCYIVANKHRIEELGKLLSGNPQQLCNQDEKRMRCEPDVITIS